MFDVKRITWPEQLNKTSGIHLSKCWWRQLPSRLAASTSHTTLHWERSDFFAKHWRHTPILMHMTWLLSSCKVLFNSQVIGRHLSKAVECLMASAFYLYRCPYRRGIRNALSSCHGQPRLWNIKREICRYKLSHLWCSIRTRNKCMESEETTWVRV